MLRRCQSESLGAFSFVRIQTCPSCLDPCHKSFSTREVLVFNFTWLEEGHVTNLISFVKGESVREVVGTACFHDLVSKLLHSSGLDAETGSL